MEWKMMSKSDAALEIEKWMSMDPVSFKDMMKSWPQQSTNGLNDEYQDLRQIVMEAYNKCREDISKNEQYFSKKEYYMDLLFGMEFYLVLEDFGFNIRMASNDQVWIYLCVEVFPDIVNERFPGNNKSDAQSVEINVDRFYKTKRRIYLKTIWWYIYLSMQTDDDGNLDKNATFEILRDNSTDEIVQIVERSGRAGYRVNVYREIMKYYSSNRDKYNNKIFRQVMVLNTARSQLIDADLMSGGVEFYVKELFDYIEQK